MARPPKSQVDVREEIDVVSISAGSIETQRNRYASRGVALIVLLNGVAAIVVLAALARGIPGADSADRFGEAMLVFGGGAAAALASSFFAYLSRTFRLEAETRDSWRLPLRWLAIGAAVLGVACFLSGLNMARVAGQKAVMTAPSAAATQPAPPAAAKSNP